MAGFDDPGRMILRNKLLGRWAAGKLGLSGRDADAYSEKLARGAVDFEGSDVLSRLREDFDKAGVAQSDEQILGAMTDLWLKAGDYMPSGKGDSTGSAAVMLARKLTSG